MRRGWQRPRIEWVPELGEVHDDAQDAIDLSEAAGLALDDWQQYVLTRSLRRAGRKWAAFEVAVVAPRQNGKNAILEARQLAGLFVLRERLQIHSAHQADTSMEAFRRLAALIEANEWLDRDCQIYYSNGKEHIETKWGSRINFRTRTKGGGRGFSGDVVYFDEAMIFPEASLGAIMPVVSAKSVQGDPQLWYTGSAVDQTIHEDGYVLTRLRERGRGGGDPSLAYFEWSVDAPTPEDVTAETATDPDEWAKSTPALGVRISEEHIANEQRSMDPRTFAVERLGAGDWPSLDGGNSPISPEKWGKSTDFGSEVQDPVVFAFDVAPMRSWATISVGGRRADGLFHVETVERRRGAEWVVAALADLVVRQKPAAVVWAGSSASNSLVPAIQQQQLGVKLVSATTGQEADACGVFFDAVNDDQLRHLGTPELAAAIRGAATRPLGEKWAWSRKNSSVDITPLVAATLALWGLLSRDTAAPWIGW